MHGDLHQDNILRDRNEWKIIDPSPVIGDPIYELTSFMINPIDKLWKYENAQEIIRNRLCKFSQIMRIGSERLAQWTFVKSVLCVIWTKGSAVRRDRIER
jgi:streptomycin 6-kinase